MRKRRVPAEFYGHLAEAAPIRRVRRALAAQHCPFVGNRCKKPRKSDPTQTIGACVLQYGEQYIVICPERFLQDEQVFLSVVPLLRKGTRYAAVPEVRVPGGSVDWFVVSLRDDDVVDYAGVEFQALDTTATGHVWTARNDLSKGKMAEDYAFGLNWRMSAKTILVQMLHKAPTFDSLGKKIVLAVQRPFFEYIRREFASDHLVPAVPRHAVHFHTYDCLCINDRLRLSLASKWSCSLEGLELMLKQSARPEISEAEVIAAIKARLPRARLLAT